MKKYQAKAKQHPETGLLFENNLLPSSALPSKNNKRYSKKIYKKQVRLPVCSYHVTYPFQSESTIYSCLDVKEILARNRCDILSLSD